MSKKDEKLNKGSFLYINDEEKAEWGQPEGYPYKGTGIILDGTFGFTKYYGSIYVSMITDENFSYTDGKSYTVIWDGEAYQCVATTFDGLSVLGNLAIAGVEDDTGEPFLFFIQNTNKGIYTTDTASTHMTTVRGEIVYPMASEFLPIESITETDPTVPAWAKAETKPSYDFSELTVNDPEAAKTVLAIEKGMILKRLNVHLPNSYGWKSVTYGNGKFVAVEIRSDQAAYSEDGINWTASAMPSSAYWESVTYGNGKFVAITYDSDKAAYSEDGINWTASTMPSSANWNSVAYGNGKFVAITSNSDKVAYSEDGISWTASTVANSHGWKSVTYGNGKFVAITSGSNQSAYSEDGINWTASTMPSSAKWYSVTYGNGKFVAVVYNSNQFAYSEDGINWTASTMASSDYWHSITYGNGKFVVIAYGSDKAAYSEDGINWTTSTMLSSEYWYSVTYGNGKFVAVVYNSNQFAYSEDGITWKSTFEYLSQNNSNITESVRSAIGIPSYSTANNGQFLRVIDGTPTWTESLPTLTSPNGTKYKLTVSDDGTLSAVQV